MDPRIIRVKGRGNISVTPDTILLGIRLEGLRKDCESAMNLSAEQTRDTQEALKPLGFEQSDLKTLSFDIESKYRTTRDNQDIFEGYEFTHEMKLEFPLDNSLLGKVLYALANSPADPEISLSFTVKDQEEVNNQLLEKAVEDAKEKAEVLTRAAGVTLGSILSIDYSWGVIEISSSNRYLKSYGYIERECVRGAAPGLGINLSPEDINLSDDVTVVWEIL